jgi:primase-polymerase (primpol)-like protein
MRSCAWCHDDLGPLVRADSRFCSTRCRVAASRHRPPAELRARNRWVRFDATKRPLRVSGTLAASTKPSTWSTYGEAATSSVGVGVGFVLNGDGIVCVDIDHCVTGNRLASWAADLLEGCPATFMELSVSGTGLHVWGTAPSVDRGRKIAVDDGQQFEIYGTSRYIAVTGRRWAQAPAGLADIDAWVSSLIVRFG